jgi:hypothetical protein
LRLVETHALSGPVLGTFMVAVGIFVGVGPRSFTPSFWRPDRSVGFTLRLLLGLCILYAVAWLLHAI